MKYDFTLVRMTVIKKTRNSKCCQGCGEKETPCTVGGNINWYSQYGKQYGGSSKNQKELSFDPAIPLLDIYLKKTKTLF